MVFFSNTEQKRRLKEALLQDLKDEADQRKLDEGFQKPHVKVDKKTLRTSDETPTYTGGVSDEARNRLQHRQDRDKQRKFHVSSKVHFLVEHKKKKFLLKCIYILISGKE